MSFCPTRNEYPLQKEETSLTRNKQTDAGFEYYKEKEEEVETGKGKHKGKGKEGTERTRRSLGRK